MKRLRLIHALLALMLAIAMLPAGEPVLAQTTTPPPKIDRSTPFVPGEVVVTFPEGQSASAYRGQASALAGQMGVQVVFQYDNIAVLSAAPDADVAGLSLRASAIGGVKNAQPNYIYWFPEDPSTRPPANSLPNPGYTIRDQKGRTRTFTADQLSKLRTVIRRSGRTYAIPAFPSELVSDRFKVWGWNEVETNIIWRNANVSPAVCEVDSGVDYRHPDLAGRVINGYDFVNIDPVANDDNGHGTHVAGIIAALNNAGGSMAGVSNGKIVAVKSMNAQGFGTSATVAAGIRYCASRTDVRVINLSLGGSEQDPVEYNALKFAIVNMGKFVVAAAGNSGQSGPPLYPAAWSNDTELSPAGSVDNGATNTIHDGLVSVAAGRSNPAWVHVWVDLNDDGVRQPATEYFDGLDCATDFTNFGKYVDIVAPGDMVWSTQPVSYPFFNQTYFGYNPKYDYYDGTSMAAPYVAGATVRMLSVMPSLVADPNTTPGLGIKDRLKNTGRPLRFAVQPHKAGDPAFDPANPFANPSNGYGAVIYPDPINLDARYVKMPYCWPVDNNHLGKLADAQGNPQTINPSENPFTTNQDATNAVYLDVSAAMGRVGFYTEATDASTGLPLAGAQTQIRRVTSTYQVGGFTYYNYAIVDTALIGTTSPAGILLNVPLPSGTTNPTEYHFFVSKPGYTTGFQVYEAAQLYDPFLVTNPPQPKGGMLITYYATLAVPPNRDMNVVLDWDRLSSGDLDLYTWLPQDAVAPLPGTFNGVVHPGDLKNYIPAYPPGQDLGSGTTLAPYQYDPSALFSPYMRVMHNGGFTLGDDILTFDSTTIRTKPATNPLPYYTGPAITGSYDVYVTDYSGNYGGSVGNMTKRLNPTANTFIYPIVRVWYKGYLLTNLALAQNGSNPSVGCEINAANDWWYAVRIKASPTVSFSNWVTPINHCGSYSSNNPPSILPYPVPTLP